MKHKYNGMNTLMTTLGRHAACMLFDQPVLGVWRKDG
jgi:hypothetical protein